MRSTLPPALAIILFSSLAGADEKPIDVSISAPAKQFRLVGKLPEPIGSVVVVRGMVVKGPDKGYEDGPNIKVQTLNGHVLQKPIQIKLVPYGAGFGKQGGGEHSLPELKLGKQYEFEGYETGKFVGIPDEAIKRAGVPMQTTGHYFCSEFTAFKGSRID